MSRPVVWADSETTSLAPTRRIWEFAAIKGAEEQVWVVADVDLELADPKSLEFGDFYQRHPVWGEPPPGSRVVDEATAAREINGFVAGATMVTAIPEFDLVPLAAMMRRHGLEPSWHYRTRCVESFVAGCLAEDAGGLQDCVRALGLDPADYAGHTALGDARMFRDCWLMVRTGMNPEDSRPAKAVLRLATLRLWQEQDEDPAEVRAVFDRGPHGVTARPTHT